MGPGRAAWWPPLGLVLKGTAADGRQRAVGGTCTQTVDVTDIDEFVDWLRNAYQAPDSLRRDS
jgi:hypothetical protein